MLGGGLILSWVSLAFYLSSSFLYVGDIFRGRLPRTNLQSLLLYVAVFVHFVFILLEAARRGYLPMTSVYEASSFIALLTALAYIVVEKSAGEKALGAFIVPLVSVFQLFSIAGYTPFRPLDPILRSPWFSVHVFLSIFAYAAFAISFVASVSYLLTAPRTHLNSHVADGSPAPEVLELLNFKAISAGFLFLTLGIATGAVWASSALGSFWRWDPKETASLVAWLTYAGCLHARRITSWHGRKVAVLSILGFISVIFTFFVVSRFFSGFHQFR